MNTVLRGNWVTVRALLTIIQRSWHRDFTLRQRIIYWQSTRVIHQSDLRPGQQTHWQGTASNKQIVEGKAGKRKIYYTRMDLRLSQLEYGQEEGGRIDQSGQHSFFSCPA
jgi:hypothetical protein